MIGIWVGGGSTIGAGIGVGVITGDSFGAGVFTSTEAGTKEGIDCCDVVFAKGDFFC